MTVTAYPIPLDFRPQNCSFSDFRSFILTISGKDDSGSWIKDGKYNSQESVDALLSCASKNVTVTGCYFEKAGLSCYTSFGVNNLIFSNNIVDGSYAMKAFFVDDASGGHKLIEYAINNNVTITNNIIIGEVHVIGAASCLIAGNLVTGGGIIYFSYDLEQQRNDLYTREHLLEPFLHLKYKPRNVSIHGNVTNLIWVRSGGYVSVHGNSIISEHRADQLFRVQENGTVWGNDYFIDSIRKKKYMSFIHIYNNLFSARHPRVEGIVPYSRGPRASTIHKTNNNIYTTSNGGSWANKE